MLVNQVVATFCGIVDDGLVQHRQARQRDLGHPVAAAVHHQRRETRKTAVSAEIEPSGRRLEGASGAEFIALQAIIGLEDGDFAGSRRQPAQAAGRRDPHIAAVRAQDGPDHVVGEAVLGRVPAEFLRSFIPLEEPLFRAEPDRPVRAAADVVDAGREVVSGGPAEGDDAVQRRVVAERTVVAAHPQPAGRIQMQGADPTVVLVHLPGHGFPGFRVDDGEAGAGGAHVQQVPGRVVDERPDPVRAHLVRVGIGFQRGAALDVVKAAQIGPEPDGAVPVAGHREDRVVVEGGVVPREHALGLPLAAAGRRPAEQAAAVRGDPQVLAVLIDVRDDGIVLARHPAGAESHVGESETGFWRHQDAGLVQAQPEVPFGVPEAGSGFPVAGFLPDGRDERGPDFLRFRVEMEQAAVLVPHEEQALFPRGGLRVEDDGCADGRGRPPPGSLPDEAGAGLEQQQAFRASQQDVARDRVFGHVVDADQVAGLLQLRAPCQPFRRLQGDGVQDDGLAVAREDPQPS